MLSRQSGVFKSQNLTAKTDIISTSFITHTTQETEQKHHLRSEALIITAQSINNNAKKHNVSETNIPNSRMKLTKASKKTN